MLKFKKAQNGDEEILKSIAIRAFQDDKDKYGDVKVGEVQPNKEDDFYLFLYEKEK